MKAFVITILSSPESCKVAERCRNSGAKFGHDVQGWQAFTPESNPIAVAAENGIPVKGFTERWSRFDRALSAFLSHYSLWKHAVDINEEILILEHDAVFMAPCPQVAHNGLLSYGQPSYGKFNTPIFLGVNDLTSKRYLPGAHAYAVTPAGAKKIMEKASDYAMPTDVFLNTTTFPWLQEYYPWPVKADDSFTTIQNSEGIRAKHNNGPGFFII